MEVDEPSCLSSVACTLTTPKSQGHRYKTLGLISKRSWYDGMNGKVDWKEEEGSSVASQPNHCSSLGSVPSLASPFVTSNLSTRQSLTINPIIQFTHISFLSLIELLLGLIGSRLPPSDISHRHASQCGLAGAVEGQVRCRLQVLCTHSSTCSPSTKVVTLPPA